jgi:23S rRNA (adenine1618-N6)-methyltransferase
MLQKKREHPKEKFSLHPRNRHRERYNFKELINTYPDLAAFVRLNDYNDESIDFSDPDAVLALNKALLKHYYGVVHWDIPKGYLCPPVPGRADYIHYIADLLASINNGKIPKGKKIKCLDVGVGANCIYPIIGTREYEWTFVGSDIDPEAIKSAVEIVESNIILKGNVEIRLQSDSNDIFRGIIKKEEYFDITICNPPFHTSLEEAQSGSIRKVSNLNQKRIVKPVLNFGGRSNELWCEGGEEKFVQKMISQSRQIPGSCFWFSTLVSRQEHLKGAYRALEEAKAAVIKTIPMSQGNKISRILAWTFLDTGQQEKWINNRWNE